jgi:signal transduction histidine kinase
MSGAVAPAADGSAAESHHAQQDGLIFDQLRMVSQNLHPSPIVLPIAAAIICAIFSSWVAWPLLAVWFSFIVLGLVPLTITVRRFERGARTAPARVWVGQFNVGFAVTNLSWASMALLLWVPDNDLDHALIVLVLASILAGGSVICGPSRQHAINCFVIIGSAIVLAPLRGGGVAYYGVSALAAIYVGFLLHMAMVYHAVARDMLLLREERVGLVERLSREVAELQAAKLRQKETERQLLHAQKLDAIGTLAGGIAHEINNTLVPVLALTKVTARRLPEGSRERENLLVIQRAAERARDLVRQILAFGRKQQSRQLAFDLGAVLRDTVRLMRSTLPATVAIIEECAVVPTLFGDPDQLHQVIVNLMTNAAQAIDGQGCITVRLGEAAGDPLGSGAPAVRLSVEDTGRGMDAATVGRIFEPFFTTKEVGGGTGLGLSVVHGIVIGHGGRIEVESAPGAGSRFDLFLPVAADRVVAA